MEEYARVTRLTVRNQSDKSEVVHLFGSEKYNESNNFGNSENIIITIDTEPNGIEKYSELLEVFYTKLFFIGEMEIKSVNHQQLLEKYILIDRAIVINGRTQSEQSFPLFERNNLTIEEKGRSCIKEEVYKCIWSNTEIVYKHLPKTKVDFILYPIDINKLAKGLKGCISIINT